MTKPDPYPDLDPDPDADPESVARTILLKSLTAAPKTRKQLSDLLDKRLVPADAARAVLDRFEELGLINDAQYAQMWVRSRHASRRLTRKVLRQELAERGVCADDIESGLEQIDDGDEYEAAYILAEKKIRTMSRLDDVTRKRRLVSMLLRRGHQPTVAVVVVEEVVADQREVEDALSDSEGAPVT